MQEMHGAATCRWARPTLFLSLPLWLDAWDAPWTCTRDGTARPLESTESCATCSGWESRAPTDLSFGDVCPHRRVPPFFLDIFVQR